MVVTCFNRGFSPWLPFTGYQIFVKPAVQLLCAMARPGATWFTREWGGGWVVCGVVTCNGETAIRGIYRGRPFLDKFISWSWSFQRRMSLLTSVLLLLEITQPTGINQSEWATLRLALRYLLLASDIFRPSASWNFREALRFLLKLLCALSHKNT